MSERQSAQATVGAGEGGVRADRFIADHMDLFSRSQLSHHDVSISINGKPAKPSRVLREGEMVVVTYLPLEEPSIEPEEMALDILYEDAEVVVVNKPQGMVVHPGAGNWSGTLAHGLMHHVAALANEARSLRPGIVHRLDKDTSGVLITAKTAESQEFLSEQFRDRSLDKQYLAIARGTPPTSTGEIRTGIIRDPKNRKRFAAVASGGKMATTEYRVIRHFDGYVFLAIHPVTGRTHQIRVHAKHIGCPILGDPIYSRNDRAYPDVGLMLHAHRLTIKLPGDGLNRTFTAPLPQRFKEVLQDLSDLRSAVYGVQRQR